VAAVVTQADNGAALVRWENGTLGVVSERDAARALASTADPDAVCSAAVASGRSSAPIPVTGSCRSPSACSMSRRVTSPSSETARSSA
jgi:hypothetical protein